MSKKDSAPLTPRERQLQAQMASFASWAQTSDRSARTAKARRAALSRFEREVDPDGTMDPVERAQRAAAARSAHFTAMAYKSARARARKGKKAARDAHHD